MKVKFIAAYKYDALLSSGNVLFVWIQITIQITKITLKLLFTNRTKTMCKTEDMFGKFNAQTDKITHAKDRNGKVETNTDTQIPRHIPSSYWA